ncbi:MAG: SHD1 domain-containing protein [Akkermansiaceae bacterium]
MKPRSLPTTSRLKAVVLGGAALCLIFPFSAADEISGSLVREWKSENGNYSIEASFSSFNPNTKRVTLKKQDLTIVEVPLAKLSAADQAFVKEQAPKFSPKRDSGQAVKLYGITWQPEVEDALTLASGKATPIDDRPVMWFRVLGKLDGGM